MGTGRPRGKKTKAGISINIKGRNSDKTARLQGEIGRFLTGQGEFGEAAGRGSGKTEKWEYAGNVSLAV